ncbi:MAG: hypothetical protein ABIS06_00990 [Vicinamibacterales bacterium]
MTVINAALAVTLLGLLAPGAQPASPAAVPLIGEWQLNLARTHYGPTVKRRRSETLSCTDEKSQITCVMRSVRANGSIVTGGFSAALDGAAGRVTGIPDIDGVELRRSTGSVVDATFFAHGKPAFAYRTFQSQDGRSLMMVTVEPVSRAALTTVVVYDRR